MRQIKKQLKAVESEINWKENKPLREQAREKRETLETEVLNRERESVGALYWGMIWKWAFHLRSIVNWNEALLRLASQCVPVPLANEPARIRNCNN